MDWLTCTYVQHSTTQLHYTRHTYMPNTAQHSCTTHTIHTCPTQHNTAALHTPYVHVQHSTTQLHYTRHTYMPNPAQHSCTTHAIHTSICSPVALTCGMADSFGAGGEESTRDWMWLKSGSLLLNILTLPPPGVCRPHSLPVRPCALLGRPRPLPGRP